jgi:hypothetical protein
MKLRSLSVLAGVALGALAVAAAPAAGSSIVYIKKGNVWLSSPNGHARQKVTRNGGWSYPSQADNGIIVALRNRRVTRLTRSGRVIGKPFKVIGSSRFESDPTGVNFSGPYSLKVSPNGKRVAYWYFYHPTKKDPSRPQDPPTGSVDAYTTTTPASHFAGGPSNVVRESRDPAWITNKRVLLTNPYGNYGNQETTWVPGGDFHNEQWWFGTQQSFLTDGELSPDGSKLVNVVAVDGVRSTYNTLYFWTANGPAFTGSPPYDNLNPNSNWPRAPALSCQNVRDSDVSSPTWSPDSRAIAYQDKDGVWVQRVGARFNAGCSGLKEKLIARGASQPDWGPKSVAKRRRH